MYEVLIAHLRECAKIDASNNERRGIGSLHIITCRVPSHQTARIPEREMHEKL